LTLLARLAATARRLLRDTIPPRIRIHWVVLRNWVNGEPELRLVPQLCDPRRASIDVGASMGTYAYVMRRRSRSVIVLEPHPVAASWLKRAFGPGVEVLEVAASDRDGTVPLRVPREATRRGMATVDSGNRLDGVATDVLEVQARRLDGLAIGPTGLIKIDVEGHEAAVLRGAQGIIARDRPVLIIEAEERHRAGAVRAVQRALSSHGYEGWYLRDGRITSMSQFDVGRDQPGAGVRGGRKVRGKRYVNNFIFVHSDDERRGEFLRRDRRSVVRRG
jgi:FkbM family methyltransferase